MAKGCGERSFQLVTFLSNEALSRGGGGGEGDEYR